MCCPAKRVMTILSLVSRQWCERSGRNECDTIPADVWDDLPADGAKNYKRYLYGWPESEA